MKTLLSKFTSSDDQTGQRTVAQSRAPLGRSRINENTKICSQPGDLKYESILSNFDRRKGDEKSPGLVPKEYTEQIAVIKTGPKTAKCVVSTDLSEDPEMSNVFQAIREKLATSAMDLVGIVWAVPTLVGDMTRVNVAASTKDSSEAKPSTENENRFREFCQAALDEGATDFHIESKKTNAIVRLRINTELYPLNNSTNGQYMSAVAQSTMSHVFTWMLNQKSNSAGHYNPDLYRNGMVTLGNLRGGAAVKLRVQSNPTIHGPDMIVRLLKEEVSRSFEELGYSADQIALLHRKLNSRIGLIYFAGIPNSGKTTSTRACLESMPNKDYLKMVMIADPVEYDLPFVSNASIQRSLDPNDNAAYQEALNSWLRGNPDVMDMGEIRDSVSGLASITVGEVGCLGLGTVHAHSGMGIVQRLTSPAIGIDIHALTAPKMLSLLIYQALVPVLCNECKIPFNKVESNLHNRMQAVGRKFNVDMSKTFYRAHDPKCPACKGRGHKGVTLAAEMIDPSEKFRLLIREKKHFEAVEEWKSISDGRWDTPNMAGKDVFAHAFYKAQLGTIDPRVVEEKFGSYDDVDAKITRAANDESKQEGRAA